jgi:iron complex transport system substrate-binding protein
MVALGGRRRCPALAAVVVVVVVVVSAGACGGQIATSGSAGSPDVPTSPTATSEQGVAPATAPSGTTGRTDAPTDAGTGQPSISAAVPATSAAVRWETEPALPVVLADSNGADVTIESIDRIVPVDGDLAEIVYALGLGEHVVAVDISATHPPEVDALPDIGYQRALSPEPIVAAEPTVVLATDLARPLETLDQVRDVGVPVVVIEREISLTGPIAKVMAVAEALGVPGRGRMLAETMQREIDAAVALAADSTSHPRTLALYLRGERVQLIFGDGTGVGVLLDAAGAIDVADELGVVDTVQITAEAMLLSRPEVLLVTTTGLASVGGIDGLLSIPGIAETPAGRCRCVLAYEDQYLLGGGPRTGQLLSELVADLAALDLTSDLTPDLTPDTSTEGSNP